MKIYFKKLVLATGEEYIDGYIENRRDSDVLDLECLPMSMILISVGKQKIWINSEFILSFEITNKYVISS